MYQDFMNDLHYISWPFLLPFNSCGVVADNETCCVAEEIVTDAVVLRYHASVTHLQNIVLLSSLTVKLKSVTIQLFRLGWFLLATYHDNTLPNLT